MATFVIYCNDDTGELLIDKVIFSKGQGMKIAPGDAGYPTTFVKKFGELEFVAMPNDQGGGTCWRDAAGVLHCPPP